jgi:general secretion pathway protein G
VVVNVTRTKGFTLIELLVVLSIIGALLAIAVPRYFGALQRSKETVLRQDLSVLREAIDKYHADSAHYPATLLALVEQRYIRAVPKDPLTGSADHWQLISAPADDIDGSGIRDVHSGAEGNASDGTLFSEW